MIGVLGIFCVIRGALAVRTPRLRPCRPAQAGPLRSFSPWARQNIRDMESQLRNTEIQVEKFEKYPSVRQVPIGNLKTNPFAYRSDENLPPRPPAKPPNGKRAMRSRPLPS